MAVEAIRALEAESSPFAWSHAHPRTGGQHDGTDDRRDRPGAGPDDQPPLWRAGQRPDRTAATEHGGGGEMRLTAMWRSLVGSLVCLAVVGGQLPAWAGERPSKGQAKRAFEHVHALAMDAEGRSLYLGAHTGLFRSEDGGRSWERMALPSKHPHPAVLAGPGRPAE